MTIWTLKVYDDDFKESLIDLLSYSLSKVYRGRELVGWEMSAVENGKRTVTIHWRPYQPKTCRINGIGVLVRRDPVNWNAAFCLWLLSWVCVIMKKQD